MKAAIKQSFYARYFFIMMAVFFISVSVIGFGEDYRAINAQHITLPWFVHVHGALLTAWLLVFLIQAMLAAKRNLKLHRRIGLLSVGLGILAWISMGIVTFNAHIGYPFHTDISWDSVIFLFLTICLFGLFFTWGIVARKNAAAHKRLLLLATLVLISAGFNRVLIYAGVNATLEWIPAMAKLSLLNNPIPSAWFVYNDLLLIPIFIYDLLTIKSIHKITLTGSACIVSVHIFLILIWDLLP
ncbi:MAG: hypothetical protein KF746_17320 [Chitinophagaceae bacterium]|nr:hypothetical protein [Chitinophagaceae bacterium]